MSRIIHRRGFLLGSGLGAAGLLGCGEPSRPTPAPAPADPPAQSVERPTATFASTWSWGRTACDRAAARLSEGGSLLDAIEAGVVAVERDPEVPTVGYGGLPNADGTVQLDAMIMRGSTLEAGAVGGLEDIRTPIAVARRVMERTRHVLLVGAGARQFAVEEGFETGPLLTEASRRRFEAWRARGESRFRRPEADHDTVGLVGVLGDEAVVGLSTSGLAYKLPGRVGDSPLVGAGGYADADVGAAAATGVGEEIIRVAGSYAVVARMEAGASPDEACRAVLARLVQKRGERLGDAQVAFVAVRRDGAVGGAALRAGFEMAIHREGVTRMRAIPGH